MAFDPTTNVKLHVALPKGSSYRLNVTMFYPGAGLARNIVVSGKLPAGSRIVVLQLPKPTSLSIQVAKGTITPGVGRGKRRRLLRQDCTGQSDSRVVGRLAQPLVQPAG
jgi:hypothetical protein